MASPPLVELSNPNPDSPQISPQIPSLPTILAEDEPEASGSRAPFRNYPKHTYTSLEYPGPVSHPTAILRLIDQQDINDCFNAPLAMNKMLDMKYRKDDRYGVPVKGARVGSAKLLLKVTRKRRRRRVVEGEDNGVENEDEKGVFKSDIIGPITQTVRFRGGSRTWV
jgi:general transcription factor 3C polypeptide 5 (transcription factor C subunit 1)